ncbi:DUF3152 domain-containing protein [Salinactinospora qingdaonensis]|uniref:DUF3152 domain-containing protein n=1 Tax=Salinactinospora qingdaonensis TaxID=702744 RepID=UPI0031EF64D9
MALLAGLAVVGAGLVLLATGVFPPGSGEREGVPSSALSTAPADSASQRPSPSPSSPEPSPTPVLLRSAVQEVDSAGGELDVVSGTSEVAGSGPLKRYLVEVEKGLPGEAADFAAAVEKILADPRSWGGDGELSFQRVDEGEVDFRVALAAPDTVDTLCAPLQTNGRVSCTQGGRAIINQNRWVSGVEHFDGDLKTYRIYVINHEVGHALGHGHVNCPSPGAPAPVMQQQTFGLQGCERNGWVHPDPE